MYGSRLGSLDQNFRTFFGAVDGVGIFVFGLEGATFVCGGSAGAGDGGDKTFGGGFVVVVIVAAVGRTVLFAFGGGGGGGGGTTADCDGNFVLSFSLFVLDLGDNGCGAMGGSSKATGVFTSVLGDPLTTSCCCCCCCCCLAGLRVAASIFFKRSRRVGVVGVLGVDGVLLTEDAIDEVPSSSVVYPLVAATEAVVSV